MNTICDYNDFTHDLQFLLEKLDELQ